MAMSDTTGKTRSKVIPGEGETAFQRWELPHLLTANQMERIQKQAYEEGFARGQADGLKDAHARLDAQLTQLTSILNSIATPLKELDDQAEQELVTLAMSAARLIVRRELKTDPAQVIAAVREAMAALPAAARNVRLHLHPDDALLVREHLKLNEEDHSWKVVEDPVLARGGCKVLTDTSQIDASVEARLTAILATVLGGERSHDRPS
jgi:flagellar assembly protein FliH